MTIQYINTGTSPNAGNGDSLRVAFSKINANFSSLAGSSSVDFPSQTGHAGQFLTTDGGVLSWSAVSGAGGLSTATVIVSNVAPRNPVLGELWYDDVSGRLYVWYDTFWVDASPRGNANVSTLVNGTYTFALTTSGSVVLNGSAFTGGGATDRLTSSTAVLSLSADGSLTLPDSSVILGGQWSNNDSGISLLTHDTDFNVYGQVSSSVSGTAYIYSGNNGGTRNLTVKTDSLNNVITIVNNTKTWTFGADGSLTIPTGGKIQDGNNYLTTSNLEIQGYLKGVDGSTGSTGQVLTRQSNGGVAWADATGGGSSNSDGGFADNSAGITITTYTLATDTGSYDNSGSVTYNIASTGATSAGIIIKGITANHTQTITGDFNQGDNTVSWGQSGIDYQLWGQMASVTAYVVDSRGYTFYTVVTDLWDVPHGPCLVEGTMITMANGTHKAIEDITPGELIRVWNFDLGEFSEAQPIWIKVEEETTGHDVYTFSDGTQLRTVGHHVFNKQAGAFTKLKLAETPVGTTTFNEQGLEVTLISKERVIEPTCYYNVWTQYHLNLFADGILTSNRFNNIYPIVDMKFVKDDRALRSVEEFAGIDEKYITGLRLREQPEEYTAEYIADYVHNRLERLDIANQVEQGI